MSFAWLPLYMGLSCKALAADESMLKRAERIEAKRLAECVGQACLKYIDALVDIREREADRQAAWFAKQCGGPMENT